MSLEDAVYRGITRGRSPGTEGRSVASMAAEIDRAVSGSARHGAAIAGVSERTWRRIRHTPGHRVTRVTWDRLRGAQRRLRLPAGREQRLRRAAHIGIDGHFIISSDERERRALVSRWFRDPAGVMADLLGAFLAGDDRRAAQVIRDAVHQAIPGMHVEQVSDVRFPTTDGEATAWSRL